MNKNNSLCIRSNPSYDWTVKTQNISFQFMDSTNNNWINTKFYVWKSSEELSVHVRSIWLEEASIASRSLGGSGGTGPAAVVKDHTGLCVVPPMEPRTNTYHSCSVPGARSGQTIEVDGFSQVHLGFVSIYHLLRLLFVGRCRVKESAYVS